MKPYSKDLRIRVLAAVDHGVPREEAARTFSVSVPTIKRWLKRRRETGDVEPKPIPGRPSRKGAMLQRWLPHSSWRPTTTLLSKSIVRLSRRSLGRRSPPPPLVGLSPQPARWRMADQKKSKIASEREEEMRGLWRWLASRFDARRLVFVDESGFNTSMTRLYARAPRGKRAYGKVPRNRGKNTTLIAAITLEGAMGESMTVEGATDSEAFEVYVEHFLAPTLEKGQVVVLDGLGAHRPKRIRELIEARGADLVFLPSYSPDFNPIEEAFSKVKALVRKEGARVREALVEAIGRALAAVTTEDAAGWFAHAGYWPQDQPL